tara:strand:- start:2068 stop:2205 length:138 start_codon:yes stop_codon:yes gene_type:complete
MFLLYNRIFKLKLLKVEKIKREREKHLKKGIRRILKDNLKNKGIS